MDFIISAKTDVGLTKETNQDSMTIKVINTCQGKMVFALMCDGMGGLAKGEVASASVVRAFDRWINNVLPNICNSPIDDAVIRTQWEDIVREQNKRIKEYGAGQGVKLGTTVTAMLITQNRYYVLNVGDSRAYKISDRTYQLTKDHTFVEREVDCGRMTPEEAVNDERRSVLLQCVGASDYVYPDMYFGNVEPECMYMLCCDGFRHEVSSLELFDYLNPSICNSEQKMDNNANMLIDINKQRGETDNISVLLIRTC